MHAFRHRSSQFTSFVSSHTSCTLVGLIQKGSKGAYDARFVTGVATANVDSSELKKPFDHKYNKIEKHSRGQKTGSSLNNTSITNIEKKNESANDQVTKAKFNKSQKLSNYISDKLSKSQAHRSNNNSGFSLKNFLVACAPDEGADTSNNLKTSAIQDVQMPVPNDSSGESDDFSELDYPSTDIQSTKLAFRPSNNLFTNATQHAQIPVPNGSGEENDDFAELDSHSTGLKSSNVATAIKKGSSSRKKQRPSVISEATLTEESFCKVLDCVSTSSISIPARKPFENRSDFEKNTGRKVDMVEMPEWKLILGDDQGVGKEKIDELARKQKTLNQLKESNTIPGGERSVCIEYVPRGISLFHLREALSIHGEIVGSFFQNGDNAMPTCYIEFKTVEAKERALAARWVFVNGKQLSIWRSDFPVTTIVRITNLSSETTATTVHSVCMSYGNVESLEIRKDGSMDVHYSINELLNMPKILEMLNEVAINDSHWIAQPAPRLPQGLAETPEGQKWVGKQLSNHIGNIKKHLQLMRIYLEDMDELHNAVMHIKECPKLVSIESFSTS